MKIIYPETQTSVIASNDSGYIEDNVLTDDPKESWRYTGSYTVMRIITSSSGGAALLLSNVDADSVEVSVKISGESTVRSSGTYDLTPSGRARTRYKRMWHEWTQISSVLEISLTFTKRSSATYVEAGIVRCGPAVSLPDPSFGLGQGRRDYSIKQELGNGSEYIHQMDKPRTFSANFPALRNSHWRDLDAIYEEVGVTPLGMLLNEYVNDDMEWCGFFKIEDAPGANHDIPLYSNISMNLLEAV